MYCCIMGGKLEMTSSECYNYSWLESYGPAKDDTVAQNWYIHPNVVLYLSILYFQECVCAHRHRLDQSLSSCSSGLLSVRPSLLQASSFSPSWSSSTASPSPAARATARASWYSLLDSSNSPEQQKTSSHDTTVYPRENDQTIYIIIYIQYAPVYVHIHMQTKKYGVGNICSRN